MKKLVFLLFFATVLTACEKDTIDPDLTKEFVGNWKGEVKVETGYEYSTDWAITRVNDNTVKIATTYKFVAKDPKYTSKTQTGVVENVMLTTTVANSVTMNTTEEITIPGDVVSVKGVGIVSGRSLTVSSTGTYKNTGQVITPPILKFTKQ